MRTPVSKPASRGVAGRIPLTTIIALVLAAGIAPADLRAISWTDDVDAALEQSERTGRPVLLLVTAGVWCDPCTWFNNNTFSEESVRSLVNAGFIPVRLIDTDGGWERWEIRRLPTVLVLDPAGEEIGRVDGAVTSAVLQRELAPHAASIRATDSPRPQPTARTDGLRGAVFRIGSAGTLWNDGGATWYSQDAGLPPRLEEYDRDETFLYLRDARSATLLGVPLERPADGAHSVLWRWNLDGNDWEEAAELERLD